MQAAVRLGNGLIMHQRDVPIPSPTTPGQVRVKVHAAGTNPVDYKLPKLVAGPIAGIDVAGVVDAVAPGAPPGAAFDVGDEVFGFATGGSVAEYALADASKLASKPETMTFVDAAAMPTAYVTSYQALFEHGEMRPGARVLIIGASGGCGLAACQLAAAGGAAEIVAVCSSRNAQLCADAGATEAFDYADDERMQELLTRRFDLVYDAASGSGAGEDYRGFGMDVLAEPRGRRVAINGGFGEWFATLTGWGRGERDRLMLTRQDGEELTKIVELLGGDPSPVIDRVFELDLSGVNLGFARQKSRRARGKIVIKVV